MSSQLRIPQKEAAQSSHSCVIPVRFDDMLQPNDRDHLTVIEFKTQNKQDPTPKQCRICLEGDQSQSKLVKPCKCTGSIEYAHVHCLIQWIKRRITSNCSIRAKCEVCDTQFNYKVASERIFDCRQLKRHYQHQKRGLICFGMIYGILFLFFITVIALLAISREDESLFLHSMLASSGGTTLIISFMIIYCLGLIVVTILFISQYLVREQLAIVDVANHKQYKALIKSYKIYFKR